MSNRKDKIELIPRRPLDPEEVRKANSVVRSNPEYREFLKGLMRALAEADAIEDHEREMKRRRLVKEQGEPESSKRG